MKGTCKDIAERVSSLPPLPDTAIKLMTVVNDPHSSVEDLVEAIGLPKEKLCTYCWDGAE